MTGYTVHTGSTEKFAAGWDVIFQRGKKAGSVAGAKQTKPAKKSMTRAAKSGSRKTNRRKK